jgi:tetratricopeptide (TPR) repeat protein
MAQNTEEELAAQYYAEEQYEKAAFLYKKLTKSNESSVYLYDNYLTCLIKLKDFKEAEKLIQKRVRKNENILYRVDQGYILQVQGKEAEAKSFYNDLIEKTPLIEYDALAGSFRKRKIPSLAEQTYLTGRKRVKLPYAYGEELLNLYQSTGESKKLVDECLNQLRHQEMSIADVQAYLVHLLESPGDVSYLQTQTLLNIQKNADNILFDKLLYWVFTQQKKFDSAYRQAMAMDKKSFKDGSHLLSLAELCITNKEYSLAVKCFEYVVNLGKGQGNYVKGRMGVLETSYAQLQDGYIMSPEELAELVANYKSFLKEFGKTWGTAPTMKELADIHIYYQHNLDAGIALLEEITSIPRLQPLLQGEVKLSLGDAYLMKDDLWEATLIYGQVDKAFKEDPLGQEAKFRNAALSYYKGDFDWAKDQLDVLKTATTQLISNNAIELALRIQDNTGLDSTTDALKDFAKAELLLKQNRLDECLAALDKLPFKYPNHALEDEIYFIKAQVFERQSDFEAAAKFYNSIYTLFPDDILADNALMNLAKMYEINVNDKQKALETYERIVLEYTGSLFHLEARKAYKRLKDEIGNTP